jgi:cellulose synthase/poly-beta-1,6-N-acetylglucosamine synthase-like glycosyltransferase
VALVFFWGAGALLLYTFAGYPWLMRWLARDRPAAPLVACEDWPAITCVVVVFNGEDRIVARVENLLAADYPAEKLSVLVVSDGSTDATAERVRALDSPRVFLVEQPTRAGKAAGLNTAFTRCHSDLVVLTDARQRFAAETIRRLVAHFTDPAVGAVSGSLEIEAASSHVGQAVGAYWDYEKVLRAAEARFDSCIGCTGAVYAIRRALFTPISPDTLLDDVVIPMQIAGQGYRVLHDPQATAFDPQPLEPALEQARKRRTLAGNFQMLFRYPHWLLPWRHQLWWQLLSHKYLRLAAPPLLALVFAANLALFTQPFYRFVFVGQCIFYILATIGRLAPSLRVRLFALPAGFVFLNLITVRAFWHYLTSRDLHRWEMRS